MDQAQQASQAPLNTDEILELRSTLQMLKEVFATRLEAQNPALLKEIDALLLDLEVEEIRLKRTQAPIAIKCIVKELNATNFAQALLSLQDGQGIAIGRDQSYANNYHYFLYPVAPGDAPDKVSRVNSEIHRRGKHFLLFDRKSAYGTILNGVPVSPTGYPLRTGDVIKFGSRAQNEYRVQLPPQ